MRKYQIVRSMCQVKNTRSRGDMMKVMKEAKNSKALEGDDPISRLTIRLDTIATRIEKRSKARDAKFNRLVEWAEEVSKKTGIPMPQL